MTRVPKARLWGECRETPQAAPEVIHFTGQITAAWHPVFTLSGLEARRIS
jgi:hypothetical protein